MSKVLIEEQTLSDIGDAIRAKNGTVMTYKPGEMANAINTDGSDVTPPILLYTLNESDGARWVSTGVQSSTIGDYLMFILYANGDIANTVIVKKENIAVFAGSSDVYTTVFATPARNNVNVRFNATDNDTLYMSFNFASSSGCVAYACDISSFVHVCLLPA